MKSVLLALPLLFAATAPAIAQDDDADTMAAETAEAELTIDSPIEVLMADDGARAVVLAEMPGLDQHPAYGQFKAMSLKAVQPYSQGMVTDEMLANIAAGLAELN
ncbi:hypothetical protein [Citromicrobium bathyomarinum]|uniref:hypothetical protein n=1 Tax=Citromicrobium bathyomarinum TaxID=72174 RepID=UPI0031599DCD